MIVKPDPSRTAGLWRRFCAIQGQRWVPWAWLALVLIMAPQVFDSHLSVSMLAQMGIAIVACLSYNMLLGQGGMLSFGHAVYTGLGSYAAIHTLVRVSDGMMAIPVSLIPLVGGVAGLCCAVVFGYVTTKKAGTPFAMITLGIGEMVFAASLMFSGFFGGEAGISANRVVGASLWGITWGPQIQVYYLIAAYTFVCVALMYGFTHTPLGRLVNAVRDNPERVEFIGYNPQMVRYRVFIIAGFFAGVAGGLAAIQFEIVTAQAVGPVRSGGYLLFTLLGGTTVFFGPIMGGVLMVLAWVLFSALTQAWLLYLGCIFLFMVLYAPGGVASLVMANLRLAAGGRLRELWVSYLALGSTALVCMAGVGAMIEMIYHLQLNAALGDTVSFWGMTLNARQASTWVGAALVALTGFALFELTRHQFRRQWAGIQAELDHASRGQG